MDTKTGSEARMAASPRQDRKEKEEPASRRQDLPLHQAPRMRRKESDLTGLDSLLNQVLGNLASAEREHDTLKASMKACLIFITHKEAEKSDITSELDIIRNILGTIGGVTRANGIRIFLAGSLQMENSRHLVNMKQTIY